MKPFSIIMSLLISAVALSTVVWVGKYGAKAPALVIAEKKAKDAPTVDDLPMPASGPLGKIEVSELQFNFGTKSVGDKDQHTFTIKNIGDGPLEFKLGKPTCQCTVGKITKENGEEGVEGPIAPGETVNILVEWVMKSQTENFRQSVPIFTTDPDRRKIELVINGSVDQGVHVMPEGLWDLGDISPSSPAKGEGYIASKVLKAFTITELPRENSRVKVTWEPADLTLLKQYSAQSGYLVKVEVPQNIPVGQLREVIKFKVESEQGETSAEFMVGARRSGPIEVRGVQGASYNIQTNRLFLGEFPAATGKKVNLTFMVRDFEENLVLKGVSPAETRVKVTFPSEGKIFGKSKSYQVQIEVPPGPAAKHRDAEGEVLELQFNHPDAPDLKLTVDYNAI